MIKRILPITSFIIFITLFSYTYHITAQSTDTPPTPTLAPSKTPTAVLITPTITNTPSVTPTSTPTINLSPNFEPFTQQDLTILVGNVQRPNGIAWFNNYLYVACNGDWTLYKIQDITGDTETYIQGIRNAHTLYIEEIDNQPVIWVPDFETNALIKVMPNRSSRRIATGLDAPWGITPISDEAFLITNLLGNSISLVSRTGDVQTIVDELRSPAGITNDLENIYFANNGSARRSIEWFPTTDINSGNITPLPLVTGLQNTANLVLANDNLLYFTYSLGNRGVVGRVDPQTCITKDNGCSNDDVQIVVLTELSAPLAGLTITPDMRLFVHTLYRHDIFWLDLQTNGN